MKFVASALAFLSVFSITAFAEDAPLTNYGTVLVVKVTNGTAQGNPVAEDRVFVRVFDHKQLTATLEGRVDSTGEAVFENVPAEEHTIAVAFARHGGMIYTSLPVGLTPSGDTHIAQIMVYDISEDNSKLSVGIHHFIIKAESDSVLITEYMQLNNPSDMAVISKEKDGQDLPVVLKILLPAGFANLRFLSYFEPAAVVVTKGGFYDTMATPPGDNHQAAFSYTLDIDSETMNIVKKISLPTSEFVLFSQLGPGKIMGLGSATGRMVMSDGTSDEYFNLSALNAGDTINFQVTGFNVIKSQRKSWIIMGVVFGITAVLAVGRASLKNKQPSSE